MFSSWIYCFNLFSWLEVGEKTKQVCETCCTLLLKYVILFRIMQVEFGELMKLIPHHIATGLLIDSQLAIFGSNHTYKRASNIQASCQMVLSLSLIRDFRYSVSGVRLNPTSSTHIKIIG